MSLLIAKAKKPFANAEDLPLPAAVVLAETMLDKDTVESNPIDSQEHIHKTHPAALQTCRG